VAYETFERSDVSGDVTVHEAQSPLGFAGLIRRIASLVAGDVTNRTFRLGATAFIARSLGPAQFGTLNLALSLAILIFTVGSLGLAEIGSRDVAARTPDSAGLIWRVFLLRTAAVLALVAVTAIVFLVCGWSLPVFFEVFAMSLAMTWNGDWLARAVDRVGVLGIATAAGGAACLVGAAVVYGSHQADVALLAFVGGECATAGVLWAVALRRVKIRMTFDGLGELLRKTPAVATSVIVVYGFYTGIDYFLIAAIRSSAAAGLYSAPYRLFMFTLNIATLASYVLLSRLAAGRFEQSVRTDVLDRVARSLGAYGLIVSGVTLLAARPILLLLFGSRYASPTTVDTFCELGIAGVLYVTAYPLGYVSLVTGSGRQFMLGAVLTASTNIVLDAVLLPRMGIQGAAIATVAALALGSIAWASWLPASVSIRRILIPSTLALIAVVSSRIDPPSRLVLGGAVVAAGILLGAVGERVHERLLSASRLR
jgi:O-antigen/teichoic acid export membrane protein